MRRDVAVNSAKRRRHFWADRTVINELAPVLVTFWAAKTA